MIRAVIVALLVFGAHPAISSSPGVWIDTDPACDGTSRHDPDDCFAILHLLLAPGVAIQGISTTFGNVELETANEVLNEFLALNSLGEQISVTSGASKPGDCDSEAASALRAAVRSSPYLEIVALGPLTNVACALRSVPDAVANVSRVVAVMGARPGHVFHPAEERSPHAFLRHGPVFSDLNLEKDPDAARFLIHSGVPLVLVPYEAARLREVGTEELEAMAALGGAPAFVASRATGWLDFWTTTTGRDGFFPFDLVAAGLVSDAIAFSCTREQVSVAPDRAIGFFGGPVRLLLHGPSLDTRAPQAEVCRPAGAPRRVSVDTLFGGAEDA